MERDEKYMSRYTLQVGWPTFLPRDEASRGRSLTQAPSQFGQGARICSGRHISIMEMNKALVELMRNFDIELADPNFELTTTTRWFKKPHALPCIFEPRTRV